jgi:hypothetical protein
MKKHNHKPLPEGAIVSQSFKRKPALPKLFKKRSFIISVGVVIVAAIIVGVWFIASQSEEKIAAPKAVDISNVSEYGLMTKEQVDYYLYAKTGLTLGYLKSHNLTSKNLKTFDRAYQAAQALTAVDDKAKALQAFAIAQDKKPKDGDHLFYLEYADVALRSGDKTTWKKEMLLAREILVKNPKPEASSDDGTELEILDRKMKLAEEAHE